MPEQECRSCYECNASFSTFRRKHHCRICGQVFCGKLEFLSLFSNFQI